jgi:hypothetical protein
VTHGAAGSKCSRSSEERCRKNRNRYILEHVVSFQVWGLEAATSDGREIKLARATEIDLNRSCSFHSCSTTNRAKPCLNRWLSVSPLPQVVIAAESEATC